MLVRTTAAAHGWATPDCTESHNMHFAKQNQPVDYVDTSHVSVIKVECFVLKI